MLKLLFLIGCIPLLIIGTLDVEAAINAAHTNTTQTSTTQPTQTLQPVTQTTVTTSSPTPPANNESTQTTNTSQTTVPTSEATTNWAGYAMSGGTYTSVSGSWTIPSVTADNESLAADATWIGIGGLTQNDLIQVGTQNTEQNGQVTGNTFYEELPDTSQPIDTVTVNPGDSVSASIKEVTGGEWTITLANNTNGQSYSNEVYYNSSESSAEWIEEAPSTVGGVIPLDQFGSVTFTNASADDNGVATSLSNENTTALTIDNTAGQALTTTDSIIDGGFTVDRTSNLATSTYSVAPGEGRGSGWSRVGSGLRSRGTSAYSNAR